MKPLSIDNIPLDDIEEAFEGENTETEGCSSLMTPAHQKRHRVGVFSFYYKSFYRTVPKLMQFHVNTEEPHPCVKLRKVLPAISVFLAHFIY